MDNNAASNQSAPTPATSTPETSAQAAPSVPKAKFTRVILICSVIAVCLIIGLVLLSTSVKNPKSSTEQQSAPTSTNQTPTEPESNTNPDAAQAPNAADYAALEKTVIPARDDNGHIPDHIRGKSDSAVVVVEYADLQCPSCAVMMSHMNEIYQEYKGRVAFVFRHYPINGHQKAMPAAIATEAAGQQGFFWEMTEALYAKREAWVNVSNTDLNNVFLSIFKEVAPSGNVEKFIKDLNNTNLKTKIQFDMSLAREYAKITGTPSIYINGFYVDTADITSFGQFVDAVKTKINAELKK